MRWNISHSGHALLKQGNRPHSGMPNWRLRPVPFCLPTPSAAMPHGILNIPGSTHPLDLHKHTSTVRCRLCPLPLAYRKGRMEGQCNARGIMGKMEQKYSGGKKIKQKCTSSTTAKVNVIWNFITISYQWWGIAVSALLHQLQLEHRQGSLEVHANPNVWKALACRKGFTAKGHKWH